VEGNPENLTGPIPKPGGPGLAPSSAVTVGPATFESGGSRSGDKYVSRVTDSCARVCRTPGQRVCWSRRVTQEDIDVDSAVLPLELATSRGMAVTITIETRTGPIHARVWKLAVGRNALLLLDSNVDGNHPEDRELTARLYGGDHRIRIR
jgi:hypothetical protein